MMKIIFDDIILSVETERFSVRAGLGNVYNEICRNVVSGRYFALPIQTQIITVCHNLTCIPVVALLILMISSLVGVKSSEMILSK